MKFLATPLTRMLSEETSPVELCFTKAAHVADVAAACVDVYM